MSGDRKMIVVMPLEWYKFGNIYTGSIGDYRYRFEPSKDKEKVKASRYTVYAYSEADDIEETDFELSESGLEEARDWLFEKYQEYVERKEQA